MEENKQNHNFISFKSKTVGKTIKARLNISQLIKYLKVNEDGDYVFDFYIAKRKKITKNGDEYIAWTDFENVDNSKMVEDLFGENQTG